MYKSKAQSNFYEIIQMLLIGIALIIIFPVVPITVITTIILYQRNIKGTVFFICGIIILFGICFFLPDMLTVFFYDSSVIIKKVFDYVNDRKYFEIIGLYKQLSYKSWFIVIDLSITMSGYFAGRLYKNKALKKAGFNSFDGSIEAMNSNDEKPVVKEEKEKTLLGANKSGKPVYCEDTAKHVFVCGTTGSGKTVLLSNFIKSGLSKNYGMLIVDGKGDVDEGSIMDIAEKFTTMYNKKLYIVNLNDPEHSAKYNPFSDANETICKDMLINMTDWSEEHYKTNTERYLQRLLKLLRLQGGKLSFSRIVSNISVSKFEELSSILAKDGKIKKEEHVLNLELIKSSGKIAENAAARFATIAESDIGTIFDESGIDIYTALKENAVILFILNPLIYPELSPVMGRLILIDGKKAVSKMFGQNGKRKFFIFDEINVYASTVLIDLINKSRSAGVTAIPATQSLADLEAIAGEPFKQQIIENCNNYVVLRQNSAKSAEEWAKTLGTKETMQVTFQIDKSKPTEVGSARRTREFIIHPDEIKSLPTGRGIFLSRDIGKCERIKVKKPF